MNDLGITLRANNSSGKQTLYLTEIEDGVYNFTLCGYLNGEPIQIDFDPMSRVQLEEHKQQIEIILEAV